MKNAYEFKKKETMNHARRQNGNELKRIFSNSKNIIRNLSKNSLRSQKPNDIHIIANTPNDIFEERENNNLHPILEENSCEDENIFSTNTKVIRTSEKKNNSFIIVQDYTKSISPINKKQLAHDFESEIFLESLRSSSKKALRVNDIIENRIDSLERKYMECSDKNIKRSNKSSFTSLHSYKTPTANNGLNNIHNASNKDSFFNFNNYVINLETSETKDNNRKNLKSSQSAVS